MKYCHKHNCSFMIECQECIIDDSVRNQEDIGRMLAKYDGWCKCCGGRIRGKQTYIARIDGDWICEDCLDEGAIL